MSGPKVSEYTLMLQRKRKLELQRIEKIKREEEKLNSKKYLEELEKIKEITQVAEDVEKLENDIKNIFSTDDIQQIIKKSQKCKEELDRLKIRCSTIKSENCNLNEEVKNDSSVPRLNFSEIDYGKLNQESEKSEISISVAEKIDYLNSFDIGGELAQLRKSIIEQLESITDEVYLKNFYSLKVKPFEESCIKYMADCEKINSLIVRYNALCQLNGIETESFSLCDVDTVEKLENQIEYLENKYAEADEQQYISECIDEVMQEMGYDLLGVRNAMKKSGKKFRNELYSFDEGTAVNVTYDSTGKITMELGGIDNIDRFPDNDEKKRLYSDMKNFCSDFEKIEKELEKRGVVLKHISLLPPDEAFAQIINTSEYDMELSENKSKHIHKSSESHRKTLDT